MRNVKYTLEVCKEAGLKCKTRKDFQAKHPKEYSAAQRKGWIDVCLEHLPVDIRLSHQHDFYVLEISKDDKKFLGFGISRTLQYRLNTHKINLAKVGGSFDVLSVLSFDTGSPCLALESFVKANIDTINLQVAGFKSEAIDLVNQDKFVFLITQFLLTYIEKQRKYRARTLND